MGKTFKDQKNYPRPRRDGRESLTAKYAAYLRYGEEFREQEYFVDDEGFKCEPGDFCPHCGEPTNFEKGFLQCGECGWIDIYPNDIEIEEAA